MHIEVSDLSPRGIGQIRFHHEGMFMDWPVQGYTTASIPCRETLFDDSNKLLAKLGAERQKMLWDLYIKARETMEGVYDPLVMHSNLVDVVNEIYEVIDYMSVRNYVFVTGEIEFPTNLKTSYAENDQIDRTYLRDDYIELVILTLGLRFVVPIWGTYMYLVIERTGNEFKEKTAFDLIGKSKIARWPGVERLRSYVEANVMGSKASFSVLMSGLSSVEIPEYLMSLAVVRKLAVSPLQPRGEEDNLIRIVYNFINGTHGRLDNKFNGNIGPKVLIKEGAEDDNSSVLDMYKINQSIPDGDKVLIEVYTENVEGMAEHVYPYLDPVKLRLCRAATEDLNDLMIYDHHVALTQWVMGKTIPPKGIQSIPKRALLRCMAVTQAVLWDWGFPELALLVTATRTESTGMFSEGGEAKVKVPKELVAQLDILYPYYRRRVRKHDPSKRDNVALKGIETVFDWINGPQWIANGPAELQESYGVSPSKIIHVPGNIRPRLAELVIRLNQHH